MTSEEELEKILLTFDSALSADCEITFAKATDTEKFEFVKLSAAVKGEALLTL